MLQTHGARCAYFSLNSPKLPKAMIRIVLGKTGREETISCTSDAFYGRRLPSCMVAIGISGLVRKAFANARRALFA